MKPGAASVAVGSRRRLPLACLLAGLALGTNLPAQDVQHLQVPKSPLVLKARGSFMVGGEVEKRSAAQLSSIGGRLSDDGHIVVNQMYVQYMIPASGRGVPVIMLHGATLSGKTYETTPDGRMGWDEYFVRRGHAVYVPDQVSRGRSGFDPAVYNDVRAGVRPLSALPNVFQFSQEYNWTTFRFGPKCCEAFPDQQYPVDAALELARQAIPDLNAMLPAPNPTWRNLATLAARLNGAVLMGHSESGRWPLDAALIDPGSARGLILIEPGGCNAAGYDDRQVATLAALPILVVFGDHLDVPTGLPGFSWKNSYDGCRTFIDRVNAARGNATMLYPPDRGIHGNSHMIMQDRNNLQIADLILEWIDRNTRGRRSSR